MGESLPRARAQYERGEGGPERNEALSELRQALHSNGVKLVLVEKLDRLARDLMCRKPSSVTSGKFG